MGTSSAIGLGQPDLSQGSLFYRQWRKMSVGGEGRVNGHPGDGMEERGPHSGHSSIQYCCLLENGRPCNRPASNASYSKRIQGIVAQRKLKLTLDPKARHNYICEYHKSVEMETATEDPVDFFHLQMATLRRYKKHFKVT